MFLKLQRPGDSGAVTTELPSHETDPAVTGDSSFGAYLESITNSKDPRNAFFAVLRRTVKAAAEEALESSPAVDILVDQRNAFRDISESRIRRALGNRAADLFWGEPPSVEPGKNTGFSMLWELAWPARFPGDLSDLIATQTFEAISKSFKKAAEAGFRDFIGTYVWEESQIEDLTDKVCGNSGIQNLFPNWIRAGWIDPPSDNEDTEEEESTYIDLMDESKQQVLSAMKDTYDNNITKESTAVRVLESMLDCRKALHSAIMSKLNRPDLTDRTGMGPFFAKVFLEDCDKSLRLACAILGPRVSKDFESVLDHLVHVESS